MAEKIYYWDSSVFCAFFEKEPDRVDSVEQFLEEAESGEVIIVTSFITITEVLKIDGAKPATAAARRNIPRFFQKDYFKWVEFDRSVAEASRDLMWDHAGLKSKDAVHIASAAKLVNSHKVELDAVHSYDKIFTKLSGKIKGLTCPMSEPVPTQMILRLGDKRRKPLKRKRRGIKSN